MPQARNLGRGTLSNSETGHMVLADREFNTATAKFTQAMHAASSWKDYFFGAAYSTRLRQAIKVARDACDELERTLDEDDKPVS